MFDIPLLLDSLPHFFISHTIGPTNLVHPSPAPHFRTSQVLLIYWVKCQSSAPHKAVLQMLHFTCSFLEYNSNSLVQRAFFLLNAALLMAFLDLIMQYNVQYNTQTQLWLTVLSFPFSSIYHNGVTHAKKNKSRTGDWSAD
jgi:hypothetical protein